MPNPGSECALCGCGFASAKDSHEHVLQKAIGGRLRVRGFICRPCNSRTGHSWDAELARQLQALCLVIGVAREDGETPPMTITTTAGQTLRMTAKDGLFQLRPNFHEEETDAGPRVHITARNPKEARQILKGLKGKYPKLDVEAAMAQAQRVWAAPEGLMQHAFVIGGDAAIRSLVKSALAFAIHTGLGLADCARAVTFLRDPAAPLDLIGWYCAADVLSGRPLATPVTCVGVHANPKTGLVIGYVEYFGLHRAVVALGRGYAGLERKALYAFDPRTAAPLPLEIDLGFDAADLEDILADRRLDHNLLVAAAHEVLRQALARQFQDEQSRVIEAAIREGLDQCGLKPGDEIAPDLADALSRAITHAMTPWLMNRVARRHRADHVPELAPLGESDDSPLS